MIIKRPEFYLYNPSNHSLPPPLPKIIKKNFNSSISGNFSKYLKTFNLHVYIYIYIFNNAQILALHNWYALLYNWHE